MHCGESVNELYCVFVFHRQHGSYVYTAFVESCVVGYINVSFLCSLSHQPNSPQVGIKRFGHYTVAFISAIQAV